MAVRLPAVCGITPAKRQRQNLVRAVPLRIIVRQTAARGRRGAEPSSTLPTQSCAAARRCLEFAPPSAVLPSTSQCRRKRGCSRFWDDPLGANQKRHATAITDAEADQMRRQLFEIAIGQISDDPGESFEVRLFGPKGRRQTGLQDGLRTRAGRHGG